MASPKAEDEWPSWESGVALDLNTTTNQQSESDTPRDRLKQDILALIAPYRDDKTTCPPFTAGELIVMAGICGAERAKSGPEIKMWILDAFAFFSRKALSSVVRAELGGGFCGTCSATPLGHP